MAETDFIHSNTNGPAPTSSVSLPTILVVTRHGKLADPVVEYSINVATRLKCKLLVAYVNPLPLLWDDPRRKIKYKESVKQNAHDFIARAARRSVSVDYVLESGRVSKVINRLCHIVRRVEFIVIDKGIRMEDAVSGAPVPVFNVLYMNPVTAPEQGFTETTSGTKTFSLLSRAGKKASSALFRTLFFGALFPLLCSLAYYHKKALVDLSSQGGIYILAPLAIGGLLFLVLTLFCRNLTLAVRLSRSRSAAENNQENGKRTSSRASDNMSQQNLRR